MLILLEKNAVVILHLERCLLSTYTLLSAYFLPIRVIVHVSNNPSLRSRMWMHIVVTLTPVSAPLLILLGNDT